MNPFNQQTVTAGVQGYSAPEVVININTEQHPVQTSQPARFQGRNVQASNDHRSGIQKFFDAARKIGKALVEYGIDCYNAAEVFMTRVVEGFCYGAAVGIGTGVAMTIACPYLAGPAFAVSITACTTGGAFIGGIYGSKEARNFYNEARARRVEQAQQQDVINV